MSTSLRRCRASDLPRLDRALRLKGDQKMRVESDVKRMAATRSEQAAAWARRLTLDDFGGRSDALGG